MCLFHYKIQPRVSRTTDIEERNLQTELENKEKK